MAITINGSGTVTGITAGGLPDGVITTDDLAANAVTTAKLGTDEASGLCKAWVNFDGTGTVAIRDSFNVSSITDNGTGSYTVNYTTAMLDANCAVSMLPGSTPVGGRAFASVSSLTSSSVNLNLFGNYPSGSAVNADSAIVCVAVFR